MSLTQLRAVLGGLLSVAAVVMACNKSKAQESTLVGPQLGESTASAPANPNAPPPPVVGEPKGVSAAISRAPTGPAPGAAVNRGPDTAADGARSGTEATPSDAAAGTPTLPQDRAQTLPQETGTTLPQDRTAPPPQPQPGVFSPPPPPPER